MTQTNRIERILPTPILPSGIKDSVNGDKLVVFIGAGVSRILGCKGWAEVADDLVGICFQKERINYKEKKALIQDGNQKKKISICHHLLEKDRTSFYDALAKSLEPNKAKSKEFPIYQELFKLRAIYVTTNADTCFDDLYFKDLIVYRSEDFNSKLIDRKHLYHLHGTIKDFDSLIFTVRSYIEHYTKENIEKFLERLFSEYSILFVGYGLEEFEILEYLFSKAKSVKRDLRHFILLPMFRGEENILTFEESYYGDLGISVIPYAIDEKGYDQLYHVIENFEKEINLSSTFIHDSFVEIEKSIDHYDPNDAKRILQLIKNDKPLEEHFFQKLTSPEWLLPLKTGGYFDPSKNPKPQPAEKQGYFTIPYWNILNYLTKVSEQVPIINNAEIEDTLIDIFRAISEYRENEKPIYNYRTNWALTKILSNLPSLKLEKKDVDYIRQFLESEWDSTLISSEIADNLFPKFLKDNNKERILRLLEITTSIKSAPTPFGEETEALMGDYWFSRLVENNKAELFSHYPLDEAKIVIAKIDEIVANNQNALLIPYSLNENTTKESMQDRFQYLIVAFARDLLDAAMIKDPENTKVYLEELLKKNASIIKRVALAIIDRHWTLCSDIFLNNVSREFLLDYNLKYELFPLLETKYASFPNKNRDLLLEWIEQGPDWTKKKENEKDFDKAIAHWKQNWLSILIPSGYEKANKAYQFYSKITNMKPERPELIVNVTFGSPFESNSPLSAQKIQQMTVIQISNYIKNFKEPEKKSFTSPSINGLSSSLREAILSDPDKFTSGLSQFLDVPLAYQHEILGAFADLWKEKKEVQQSLLLDYCKQLILFESFWDDKKEKNNSDRMHTLTKIADLIVEGTKDDSHAFLPENLPSIKIIVLELLKKTPSEISSYPDDILTANLNSAKGRAIAATVNYSLRVVRMGKYKEGQTRWDTEIKTEFTKRLDRDFETSLEWSVSLGQFLPNLTYLDKEWVEQNIDKIFPTEKEEHWKAAFEGYLIIHQVYPELYRLIKSHGHYQKAIMTNFRKESRTRLIGHICIGVLRNEEEIRDSKSLIRQTLDLWNADDINEIIMFFWMQRKYIVENIDTKPAHDEKTVSEYKQRIIAFSLFIYGKLEANKDLSNSDKQILSRLGLLACFLKSIDQANLPWLETSAKFMNDRYSHFFLEYLDKLADTNPVEVGKIFLNLADNLESYTREEKIKKIVSKLYEKNQKNIADKICNTYFMRGLEFLRELYEANKKTPKI